VIKTGLSSALLFALISTAQAGEGHVGEIRYSILTPPQFTKAYGPEWELMKGQDLPDDSDLLALWGQTQIPDSRGLFLRCSQEDRKDGLGNPDVDLKVGTYQADEFKSHDHGGKTGDDAPDHTHGHSHPGVHGDGGYDRGNKAGASWPGARTSGASERHQHVISAAGGNETRPRCIIVNAFIKIKESTPHPAQTASSGVRADVTPEMMSQIAQHPEFQKAVHAAIKKITFGL
jgi:hypothetical protein